VLAQRLRVDLEHRGDHVLRHAAGQDRSGSELLHRGLVRQRRRLLGRRWLLLLAGLLPRCGLLDRRLARIHLLLGGELLLLRFLALRFGQLLLLGLALARLLGALLLRGLRPLLELTRLPLGLGQGALVLLLLLAAQALGFLLLLELAGDEPTVGLDGKPGDAGELYGNAGLPRARSRLGYPKSAFPVLRIHAEAGGNRTTGTALHPGPAPWQPVAVFLTAA